MALASDREGRPTASFDTNRVMGGHVYWLLEQLLKVGPWRSLAWYEGCSWTIVGDGLDSKCCKQLKGLHKMPNGIRSDVLLHDCHALHVGAGHSVRRGGINAAMQAGSW